MRQCYHRYYFNESGGVKTKTNCIKYGLCQTEGSRILESNVANILQIFQKIRKFQQFVLDWK